MLSVSIAVVTWAANAFADSPNLMGAYGFTRTVKCIVSVFPFDDHFRATVPTFGESFAEEGVRTFNGDGNGKQSFHALDIVIPGVPDELPPPHVPPHVSAAHVVDQPFAYTIGDDGTWGIQGGGSISGFVDKGPRAGQTFTIMNIAPPVGHMSTNAATLTLSTVTPAIETITYYDATNTPIDSFYRICNRSSVEISQTATIDAPSRCQRRSVFGFLESSRRFGS
jgi:hypothetical protein